MVLDMTSMKLICFGKIEWLQYDYTFDPVNGVYVGKELVPSGLTIGLYMILNLYR